ncbi:MAG: ATP-binding cassette domain-containing protein [Burkholderiales bacterium]|nr:ATP-binding cassette domain-containing protein [Burkholderiales bacterium]MDE2397585.1 ATP-binding cassette domain-containing protein [Burkholderiales bacterium]MDE2456367.1 ATP-binding cassette domain-containing protein [Burkholderiales bacterium]
MSADTLLSVRDLHVHFPVGGGLFGAQRALKAVDGVSFDVKRGSTFGIVGESGSGKSTTALAVMRLVQITAGEVTLGGTPIGRLQGADLRRERRRFQMVFQDPFASLNPRKRAGDTILDALNLMDVGKPAERPARARELFIQTGLRPEQLQLFPHQFSGGQRQRIVLARALAARPELVVCDEPVSALDVAIQAQMLNTMMSLQREFGLTYLFISHDLGVVRHMCDEVAVMYLGRIVERAPRDALFERPLHPYTRALWSAAPSFDPGTRSRASRVRLQGDPPSPLAVPPGCRFAGRCPVAQEACRASDPALREVQPGHFVACHRVDDAGRRLYAES